MGSEVTGDAGIKPEETRYGATECISGDEGESMGVPGGVVWLATEADVALTVQVTERESEG